jgi:hypothetical protein
VIFYRWGQADRGSGFGFAHLFPRDAGTGLDDGHRALCGQDPTARHNGQVAEEVRFQAAPDDATRCMKCELREAWGFCDKCGHSARQLIAGCACCESWRNVGREVVA